MINVLTFILGMALVHQSSDAPLPDVTTLWQRLRPHLMGQYNAGELLKGYTYQLSSALEELEGKGNVKKTQRFEYEVYHFDQGPFRKLVSRDGKPLDAKELKAQDREFEKFKTKKPGNGFWPWQKRRSAEERAERLDDLFSAFDFTVLRRETRNGRPTIVVDFKPRKNPKLKTMVARMFFTKVEGTAWVDEADGRLAKVHIHFLDNVKMAFGLMANVSKDTEQTQEWTKVNDEIWLPLRTEMRFKGRMLLAKGYNLRVTNDYSDYKKFRVETTFKVIPEIR